MGQLSSMTSSVQMSVACGDQAENICAGSIAHGGSRQAETFPDHMAETVIRWTHSPQNCRRRLKGEVDPRTVLPFTWDEDSAIARSRPQSRNTQVKSTNRQEIPSLAHSITRDFSPDGGLSPHGVFADTLLRASQPRGPQEHTPSFLLPGGGGRCGRERQADKQLS